VYPHAIPIKQLTRCFSKPKRKAIDEEVDTLLEAKSIGEIKQSTWVANPVLAPKKNMEVLRMCVDYMALNKHYPKDHFSLPCIDKIVKPTASFRVNGGVRNYHATIK
jgi:hypothetical protein